MDLKEYLIREPRARLRRNKNRAIGNIILEKYSSQFPLYSDTKEDKAKMADMVGEILSLDRKWRKILEENPDLRGSDYKEKDILEQKAMLELGYEPNYNQKLNI